ncbi:hypothetical protein [Lacimicrobium alkaliphilum]|uniref:hypothetical protein n=1 Tax=Lacimicrobium alkaliphilum TaxID=1526571 RepID=UPI0012E3EA46|nr:hypothetical protein [Lacimicrobium alkaliphilum]
MTADARNPIVIFEDADKAVEVRLVTGIGRRLQDLTVWPISDKLSPDKYTW